MRSIPRVSRLLRRHRRPVAAALAATGVLVALASLRGAPPAVVDVSQPWSGLRPGEVAIPVVLSSAAVARILTAGDVIDVVGLTGTDDAQPRATVVAPGSRVLEVPDAASTFGSSSSAVVLLAVREVDALDLSAASAAGPVTVVIRTQAQTG